MKKILIATLGDSPAVVTEAIDALRARGVAIDAVIVMTTRDRGTQGSLNLLSEHIPRYYNGKVEFWDEYRTNTFYDVDTDQAAVEFMRSACHVLRGYRKSKYDVYVCIAGGRKAMSALMTLAVQFYGATMLFHVLVDDPELEEAGKFHNLRNMPPEDQNKILHPDVKKIKLVSLPFVGLFPLLGDIVRGLKSEDVPREIKELLKINNLVDDKGKPTPVGNWVLEILNYVEALPEPRSGECEIHIPKKEPKEYRKTEEWANRICRRFNFVRRIESIPWRKGVPKVKSKDPNIIEVYLKGAKVRNLGFRLITTAQTQGQLKHAEREVERWMRQEVG